MPLLRPRSFGTVFVIVAGLLAGACGDGASSSPDANDASDANDAVTSDAATDSTVTTAPTDANVDADASPPDDIVDTYVVIDPVAAALGPLSTSPMRTGADLRAKLDGEMKASGYLASWPGQTFGDFAASDDRPGASSDDRALALLGDGGFAYYDTGGPIMGDGEAYTVAFWIHPTKLDDGNRTILARAPQFAVSPEMHTQAIYLNSGRIVLDHFYVGFVATPAVVTEVDTWYHVAVTHDAGAAARIYVNGVLEGGGNLEGVNEGANDEGAWFLTIGATLNEFFPEDPFEGRFDDLGYWARELSAADVARIYADGLDAVSGPDDDDETGEARLLLPPATLNARLDPSGDVDQYAFEATEGDFFLITAGMDEARTAEDVDTVISIYAASGALVGVNDDASNWGPSLMWWRAPSTGRFTVRVEECWTAAARFGYACTDPTAVTRRDYNFGVYPASPSDGLVFHDEADDAAGGRRLAFVPSDTPGAYSAQLLFGTLDDGTDVDTFRVIVPSDLVVADGARPVLTASVLPGGPRTSGSTAKIGAVTVRRAGSADAWAEIGGVPIDTAGSLWAPVEPGVDYVFEVGARGVGGYYVLELTLGGGNPLESATGNDTRETADALETFVDGARTSFFVGGDLPHGEGDVDFFELSADGPFPAGAKFEWTCGAWKNGSGVRALETTLLDETGAELHAETFGPTAQGWVTDAETVLTGAHPKLFVRVERRPGEPAALSSSYRCGFHVTAP